MQAVNRAGRLSSIMVDGAFAGVIMNEPTRYWFPAKRYGWGWGLPATWQGWVVLAVFALLVLLGVLLFPPKQNAFLFFVHVGACIVALVAVCYLKGEPPAWRWGDKR
jgi:hypothetical protein